MFSCREEIDVTRALLISMNDMEKYGANDPSARESALTFEFLNRWSVLMNPF